MALYGILGDVHGNKEALLAALGFLRGRGVQKILCVGDIVGFNADSNECIDILVQHGVESVAGNHDLISTRRLGVDRCSDMAAYALKRTRCALTRKSREFLGSLPPLKVFEERFVLIHGGVRDVQLYMRTPAQVRDNAGLLEAACPGARVCFFGHTHTQRVFEVTAGSVSEIRAEGSVRLRPESVYFINPGSIDAARKTDFKQAECAIFDSSRLVVEFHQVAYNHKVAEAKAQAQGYRMHPLTARLYSLRRRLHHRIRRLIVSN